MFSLKILDLKTFMSNLLVHDMFDSFLLSELEIVTSNKFKLSGKLYKGFYSSDEIELLEGREHSFWKEIKAIAFDIIKGNKLPLTMKIILMLPKASVESIVEKSNLNIEPSNINGLFLNFKFENDKLICTTGSSLNIFTLDKSLDNLWDEMTRDFFSKKGIATEPL